MGGHHASSPVVTPDYTGLQLQTSSNAIPITIVWGINQIAPNIIWNDDFAAIPQYTSGSSGGKGGGGSGATVSSYNYQTAIMLGLCEGPITAIGTIWQGQSTYSLADLGWSAFLGTNSQTAWGYLASQHADEVLTYPGLAYVASPNFSLGSGASLSVSYVEVYGPLYESAVINAHDADPALVIQDFLTNAQYGVGFPPASIDATTLLGGSGGASYQAYCMAAGLALSPALTNQEAANSILSRWLQLTNTAAIWSDGKLKFIPYGDSAITGTLYAGGSVTFVPNLMPVYSLTDDDFVGQDGTDPVQVSRSDAYAASNWQSVEYLDRGNAYAATPATAFDQNAIDLYGLRIASTVIGHEVCDASIAATMAQLILQRGLYIRNSYTFKLSWEYCLLEPMDLIDITDIGLGLNATTVRITEIEEDESGLLSVTAEEFPAGTATTIAYPTQTSSGNTIDRNIAPDAIHAPLIFEPPAALTTGGQAEVWIGASGGPSGSADPNWGGAIVWISADNVSYASVGIMTAPARQAFLTAPLAFAAGQSGSSPPFTMIDGVNTLSVSLAESGGALSSTTLQGAENAGTLAIVGSELLAFETATLTAPNAYALSGLARGLYGSTPAAHASGAAFTRLDEAIFKYQLPALYIGQTFYLKLQSFNVFGNAVQDLSSCVAYPYTPVGSGRVGPVAQALAVGTNLDCGLASGTATQADDFGLASDPYPNLIDLGVASS